MIRFYIDICSTEKERRRQNFETKRIGCCVIYSCAFSTLPLGADLLKMN